MAKTKTKTAPKPKRESAQSRRFKEAARAVGADESGDAFERAFKKLVPAKRVQP